MLYYKVLNQNNEVLGYVTLNAFRFYHPKRKRMFMTDRLKKAQYIIFNGQYYRVPWLAVEDKTMVGKYPEINLLLTTEDEYIAQLEKENLESK